MNIQRQTKSDEFLFDRGGEMCTAKKQHSWNECWMNIAISYEWVSAWAHWIKMFGVFCVAPFVLYKLVESDLLVKIWLFIAVERFEQTNFLAHTKCARCV